MTTTLYCSEAEYNKMLYRQKHWDGYKNFRIKLVKRPKCDRNKHERLDLVSFVLKDLKQKELDKLDVPVPNMGGT